MYYTNGYNNSFLGGFWNRQKTKKIIKLTSVIHKLVYENNYFILDGVGENRHHIFFFRKALDKKTNVLYNSKLVNNVFALKLNIN